ncbi:MAG: DUF1304 domain-containing protein [Gammaproteobacteria bacterium]|nr:DUF1304 domain-containing protein [Gammaproteobacteria bacterium]
MLKKVANFITGLVAIEHIGILVLEMFYWDHPVGRKVFNMTAEVSNLSATLAANQGLYNGFLAAGLIWGLLSNRKDVKIFFLSCVVIAGIFGAVTAKPSILLTQAMPAFIGLVLWLLQKEKTN